MKFKRKSVIGLAVLLALCLVSMIGANIVQSSFGKVTVKQYNMTTEEIANEIKNNNENFGKDVEVSFTSNNVYNMSFTTYIPQNASTENKVPAIIVTHGMYASRQVTANLCIELSRRGFVIINIDGAGHGKTDFGIDSVTHNTWGIEAIAEYAMSLGCVDANNVAVTGHSRGGTVSNAALTQINSNTSNHIRAYLSGSALKNITTLSEKTTEGVIFGLSDSKYEEGDSKTYKTGILLTNKEGIGYEFIRKILPSFNDDMILDGRFYTSEGILDEIDFEAGYTLKDVSEARVLYNPSITHPMWLFSNIATKNSIDFFYSVFGVPSGAEYIKDTNQYWILYHIFSLIGLIAFYGLFFPLSDILLSTSLFSCLRKEEENADSLAPRFGIKEGIIWFLCFAILTAYGFFTFARDFRIADSIMPIDLWPYGGGVGNGMAVRTLDMGVVCLVAVLIIYFIRRIIYKNDNSVNFNPFTYAKIENLGKFFLMLLFGFVLVMLMYIPVYIAWYIFKVDFRFAIVNVQALRLIRIPSLLKYLPILWLFYFMHAIMNIGFRYRNIPNWLSTAICAFGNALPLLIFIFVQYSSLFGKGYLWDATASTPSSMAYSMVPSLAYVAVTTRYLFFKTKNVWLISFCNSILITACSIGIMNMAVTGYIF